MKKVLKWLAIGIGSLVLLLVIAYTVIYFKTESRINKQYAINVQQIAVTQDSAALVRGEHLVQIKGCRECHGEDLGGKVFIDDPQLGRIVAANLTQGKGGIMREYTKADLTRALKHGVRKDGKSVLFMPSEEYNPLSAEDLGALMSYVKSLRPVDRELPKHEIKPLLRVLTAFDKFPLLPAEKIDHTKQSTPTVTPEITANYGQYVAVACIGCHRTNYKGGEPLVPGSPMVPNITKSGNLGKWTEAEFINTLRTGKTPEGKQMDPKNMPWTMTKEFSDTEIKSVYLFLKNLPAEG
ncbi:c-type cytochrome [Adhaeribacter swui]|uniref:C-type cytochrome n=1 Tax=Adhaeribacter swui TaxID=2086471 RepID=A0A7G7G3Y2_9BACT|nr:c-type cytochrome [Adhaeribacter swui]QNF31866.1 c-type cytochrome [Adhaeribacter swui]